MFGKIPCRRTRLVVTHVRIEKMCNKNIEIGFQSAVFRLCQAAFIARFPVSWLRTLFRGRETQQSSSYNFSFLQFSILSSTRCYEGVKIIRLLSFNKLSSDRYSPFEKRPLAISRWMRRRMGNGTWMGNTTPERRVCPQLLSTSFDNSKTGHCYWIFSK